MTAQFIVVEGLEGAGKSTAISNILAVLAENGVNKIVQTREPGGTVLAEKMRALVKEDHDGEELHSLSELLLMYAARVQLVENVIKPALSSNQWVVGDRHDLSSQAYQGGGRQINRHIMDNLKETALGGFKPDLTLYLDIDPTVGLNRARGRGELDRIEQMDITFFERARERYLEAVESDPTIILINAQQELDAVSRDIRAQLELWLQNNSLSKKKLNSELANKEA